MMKDFNFDDYEERQFTSLFDKKTVIKLINEYQDSIKEHSCLGRYIAPCYVKIRLPKWEDSINPGYNNPRKGFCTIEIGIGPDYPISFYGFKHEEEYIKWLTIERDDFNNGK